MNLSMVSKKYLVVFFSIASAIAIILIFAFAVYTITIPLSLVGTERSFSIKSGEGFREIADRLKTDGIIRNAAAFKFYVILKGWADKLKTGDYKLSQSDSIEEIAAKIYKGEKKEEVRIVIPEGYDIFDIDRKLAEAGMIKEKDLVKFEPMADLQENYSFFKELSKNEGRHSLLEGFLFPDTYYFFKTSGAELGPIIIKFLDNFNIKINPDFKNEISKRGLNLYDVLIMASLIEKEISFLDERAEAAGILWKRLENNMPLQADATILFIKKSLTAALDGRFLSAEKLTADDYEIDSPYNTYLYKGLPPGPICNPGLESIKATIFYKDTDYWYYLSGPKTGKTIFAKTFEEHKKNKKKYLSQ